MENSSPNKLIVIAGPTASGKTALAINIAKKLNTEIISCDSRQFYREIPIGTAQPTAEQLQQVKHHFIGDRSVEEDYSAGKFETDAITLLEDLFKFHDQVVMTGGSGLYIDAVICGLDNIPFVEEKVKEKLNEIYQEEGLEMLRIMLRETDPDYYNRVDLNNPHRIIRALGVSISSGIAYSKQRKEERKQRDFGIELIGVNVERQVLYNRINQRVDEMMSKGLLEEARSVIHLRDLNSLQTVGYKELFQYLDGDIVLDRAVDLIKQNTRRFAKRQMTWFRKYPDLQWMDPEEILDKF